MLMALGSGGRIAAERADRAVAHRCPGCGSAVALKRGPVVVAHFAHAPGHACAWAGGETAEHLAAKHTLGRAFALRGLTVDLEAEVVSGEGDRRADILVRDPASGRRVAIEVQHSALALEAIERRTRAYAAAGVGVIWVPTIDPARLGARWLGPGNLRVIDRYAVPAWQRFAFAYHGVLWFWHAGALWRGALHDNWVAQKSDDNDADGSPWKRSTRWSGLTLEGPFRPDALKIKARAQRIEPYERFALPPGHAANFVVAGKIAAGTAPATTVWSVRAGRTVPTLAIVGTRPRACPDRAPALRPFRRAA